jgi:formamidopyrimidine-DNA glycosylase
MTGQLLHRATDRRPRLPPAPDGSHVHAVWEFDHGRVLFRDPRRFGALRVFASTAALDEHWAGLGPDALTITADQLAAALRGSARPVKAALLDQAVVAGVGNIYADEALFAAGVRPTRLCRNLRDAQIQAIASSIRAVLAGAVQAGGSTLRDYVDGDGNPGSYQRSHAVYGRAGEPCPRCGRPLKSVTVAQRTTVWCSACQR